MLKLSTKIISWAGKGEQIPVPKAPEKGQPGMFGAVTLGSSDIPVDQWSMQYQWLPSNVRFTEDGQSKLSSYVNNLHPQKHASIYELMERLIDVSLPMWDQALKTVDSNRHLMYGPGRMRSRFDRPTVCSDDNSELCWIP